MFQREYHDARASTDSELAASFSHHPSSASSTVDFTLSERYIHLVESPDEFRPVIASQLSEFVRGHLALDSSRKLLLTATSCSQHDTLPQLGRERLRQAKGDIVFLKANLDDEDEEVPQVRAEEVFSSGEQ